MHSPLTPSAAADALRSSVDEERRTFFSLSGYEGDRSIVGKVSAQEFNLQKRRRSRNDFAGRFFGRFRPEAGGTRIEGYFDMPRWARWYWKVWLCGAVLIGVPLFVATILNMLTGHPQMTGDTWVGLVVPPALILFGLGMPKLGWLIGKKERQFILGHIQQVLAARVDGPPPF